MIESVMSAAIIPGLMAGYCWFESGATMTSAWRDAGCLLLLTVFLPGLVDVV